MKVITLYIHQLRKDALMEFLHTLMDRADNCQTIKQNMGKWLTPLQAAHQEMLRLYYISLKSPLTEKIQLTDAQRDGIITGIKAFVNSYLKSVEADKRNAARMLR